MEDLKNCWSGARFSHSSNEHPDNRRKTALATLATHYKRFSTITLILALCMPIWLWGALQYENGVNIWIKLGGVAFGMLYCLTASFMDRWLYNGVSNIDVATMPVAEVFRLTFYYRKKHFQFMGILIPMAVIFIGALAWLLSGDIWSIYGMIAGGLVGLTLGIREFKRFMEEYRDIAKD